MDLSTAQLLLSCIDLTSLNDTDNSEIIQKLCDKAITPHGHVAAVCVYPPFVRQAAQQLKNTPVKIATVVNFPSGNQAIETVVAAIHQAKVDGAQEIDAVLPYQDFLNQDQAGTRAFIEACKTTCGENILLKIILETGALKKPELIAEACRTAILAGADFVKTSTGKIAEGATIEAATIMLLTIQGLRPKVKRPLGLKVSGGIREPEQAQQYYELACRILGEKNITPATFRIGASQLVDKLLANL